MNNITENITDSLDRCLCDIIDNAIDNNKDNNVNKPFDIKDHMDSHKIRQKLINYPTELSLFEITCILINSKVNKIK